MAFSSSFTVNSAANPAEHTVAYGATVSLALVSLDDIGSVEFSIIAPSKSDQALPTVTPSGIPSGVLASFVMPADTSDGLGRAFRVQCKATSNSGVISYSYGVVGAVNARGQLPLTAFEELDRGPYGAVDTINSMGGTTGALGAQATNTALLNVTGSSAVPSAGDIQLLTATQGTATAKIAPYPTMADLRAVTPVSGRTAETQGHTTAGIGPGKWIGMTGSASTWTHDGIKTIVPASGTGSDGSLAWVSLDPGAIDVRRAGAVCDGTANDSAETIAALAAADPWISFPPGVSVLAAGMSLDEDKSVNGQFATLYATANSDVFFDYAAEFTNYDIRRLEDFYLDANGKTGVIGFQTEGCIRTEIRSGRGSGLLVDLAFNDVSFYNIIEAYQGVGGASGTSIGLRLRGGTLGYYNSLRFLGKAAGQSLVTDNSLTLPISGQTFDMCSFEGCGIGTIAQNIYGCTWRDCHWEGNGQGAHYTPNLTIEGVVIPATYHDFYADDTRALLVRPSMNTNGTSSVRAINGSVIEIQKSQGTISPSCPLVTCDSTSRAVLTTGGHRLYGRGNQYEFRGEVESIDNWNVLGHPCREIEDSAIVSLFESLGGNTWVPEPQSVAAEVVDHGSYYDSVMGPVKQIVFDNSIGTTSANRVTWTGFSGSAVAGRVQGAKIFVRTLSGSGAFNFYSPRGNNNMINAAFTATTEWQCVMTGGTVSTVSSSDTQIYFYPTDAAGLTVEVTSLITWDVAAAPDCGVYLRGHCPPKSKILTPTTITSSRVLTAADFSGQPIILNASTMDIDVPQDSAVAAPVGSRLKLVNIHANTATITAGSGATFAQSSVNVAQYTEVEILKTASNTWIALL